MRDLGGESGIVLAPDHFGRKHITPAIVGLVLRFFRSRASRKREKYDYEHLLALPDYLLADVGVTRVRLLQSMRNRTNWRIWKRSIIFAQRVFFFKPTRPIRS